jgi:LmbE family N-acetylglucosaminyl deacetylase
MPVAFAIAAHPDDIEFHMAGTLLLLGQAGWELHYLNVASGNCGSAVMKAAQTRRVRRREAQAAARLLGATWHPPLCDDLEVFYEVKLLRRLAAIVREVKPDVVLTHPTVDYMEDHMNAARLAVTAAFARCIPNFVTVPRRAAYSNDCTVYHCMPHGLRDPMGGRVEPHFYINTSGVQDRKRAALACHRSQKEWLDATQGMDSYLHAMDDMAAELGNRSKRFRFAEGWRRHLHLGFCGAEIDPLPAALEPNWLRNRR